jgi:hypothetical protein
MDVSNLRSTLSAGLLPSATVSFATGVCFHLCIRDVEIDYRLWSLTAIYNAVLLSLLLAYLNVCQITLFSSILRTGLIGLSFNTGLTASILTYRLVFHRLKSFPGPLGAKASRMYAVASSTDLQYYKALGKLHEKYGDFVRTGMQVCIRRL